MISPHHLAAYNREGVLFPIPVLTAEETARFRAAVEDLESRLGGKPAPAAMTQPQLHFRWAFDLATHPAVLDVVERILGPDILVHSASIFSKHPRTPDYVSWHQDGHYWGLDAPRLTSAWIALTGSTPENGCLRVVPGSHRLDRLPHGDHPGKEHNLLASGLEVAVAVDERQARDVVLAPGQMSLHHVNIVHGSNPNRSDGKRIGFAVRYVAPEVRQSLEHHPVVLARGVDRYGNFPLLPEPPGDDIQEGLRAQAEFGRRRLRARLGR